MSALPTFTSIRTVPAPHTTVWRAWSEPERLQHWWGPKGSTVDCLRFEFRPGGFFHYGFRYANGPQMWGRFNYREIDAPNRLRWLNSFSNDTCGVTRAPFAVLCPLEIDNTVTFEDDQGQTRITLTATPHGATPEEVVFFAGMLPSMEQGYGGTFDQLAAYLACA